MSTAKTKTRENFESDAYWRITEIHPQMITAMIALKEANEYHAILRTALSKSTAVLVSASDLVDYAKAMLNQTNTLKSTAARIHEDALKLDHAICQLEALEKEEDKCETR